MNKFCFTDLPNLNYKLKNSFDSVSEIKCYNVKPTYDLTYTGASRL